MKHERHVIAVDFDGTLTNGEKYWECENHEIRPNKEMIKWVNEKYIEGGVIIIHTARPWSMAKKTVAWLIENNVKYHGVNFEKMGADLYVDDKCVNVNEMFAQKECEEVK